MRKKTIGKGILAGLVALVIFSAWTVSSAAEPPALAKLSGAEKARVAKLIEGAKKEGKLEIVTCAWRPDIQAWMVPMFRKEYGLSESDLDIKIVSARTGSIVTKITEELRAGVRKTDIVQNGTVGWFNDLIARGEVMAYDCPEYKHFHPLAAEPKKAPANPPYFIATHFETVGIVYNPKCIKGEINHWKDVLRPEYKGKLCVINASVSYSICNAYLALRKVLGPDFFRALGKMDPFIVQSASLAVNKATSCEYPINCIGFHTHGYRANLKGAGLKLVFPPEGFAAVAYPLLILKRAPHPNAAKLMTDFVHAEPFQDDTISKTGALVGRLGLSSKYSAFPRPIYDIKGVIEMDWREESNQDRVDARAEFKKLVLENR